MYRHKRHYVNERRCSVCGRLLQHDEICHCDRRTAGVKDGLRAVCSEFEARSAYHGRYFILCGGRKTCFGSVGDRDEHYRKHCCCECGTCPIRGGGYE